MIGTGVELICTRNMQHEASMVESLASGPVALTVGGPPAARKHTDAVCPSLTAEFASRHDSNSYRTAWGFSCLCPTPAVKINPRISFAPKNMLWMMNERCVAAVWSDPFQY